MTRQTAKKGENKHMVKHTARLRYRSLAFVGVAMMTLSGCASFNVGSSEYGCSGVPDGIQCKSARDIYAMTNDGSVPAPMHADDAGDNDGASATSAQSPGNTAHPVIDNYVAPQLPDQPVPVRTPSQVMRIWVAPWEDTDGDLNMTGYVYTEIEPRRWVIGDGVPQNNPVLQPLKAQ